MENLMKIKNWFASSALLLSATSYAGVVQQGSQVSQGSQVFQGQQQVVQDMDVQSLINDLRNRCEIYEQHDQIYPFKIKVNFRGRFVRISKKPFCATFAGEGTCSRKLSMKYSRFCTPDQHDPFSEAHQLKVTCEQFYAQKYETLNKGPLLTFELNSCSEINAEYIKAQAIDQLNRLVASDDRSYFVEGSEALQYDTCANFANVATFVGGACEEAGKK